MAEIINKKENRKNNSSWEDNTKKTILYADFMGFKSRIYSWTHDSIKNDMIVFHSKFLNSIKTLGLNEYLKFVQFSDSLLLVVNGIDEKMIDVLSRATASLFHISMGMRLPIKGVIAQGEFSYDEKNELYLGRPLVDAYLLHEEIKYYGVVVHHTAENTIKNYNKTYSFYSNTPIPLLKGKVSHYHLCWNLISQELYLSDITSKCNEWLDIISESVSGEPRMYIDRTKEVLNNDQKVYKKNHLEAVSEESLSKRVSQYYSYLKGISDKIDS